jgi:hypothetical protein
LSVTFYALPAHLSFCEVDGRTIFLDLRRDRYIQLDADTRSILDRCRETDPPLEPGSPEAQHLQRLQLIVPSKKPAKLAAVSTAVPTRSLRDEPSCGSRRAWHLVPEVLALLLRSRRTLKSGGLEVAVNEVRRRNSDPPRSFAGDGELRAAAERFRAARRLIPVQPNCLLDSLALSRFLSRRGLRATLVFGVKLDPFAAHCWLQTADSIVNDGADSITPFTPILAV